MAAKKYLALLLGKFVEVAATVISAGAGDDGKIVGLDSTGKLDASVMPSGIGAEVASYTFTEAATIGAFVNIYDAGSGVFRARNADATTAKPAMGWVLTTVANGANANVQFAGINAAIITGGGGMLPGRIYLSTVPGQVTQTVPSASGQIVQMLGNATSSSALSFDPEPPVTLA